MAVVDPLGPPNISDPAFSYETAPQLFLFTSLTAGSSHIITATSRMETILKANRIPFYAIDTATDERARRIWTRRSAGKKIPGLVRQGMVLGDLEAVEEWNEFDEIKDVLLPKSQKPAGTTASTTSTVAAPKGPIATPAAPPKENIVPTATQPPPAPALPSSQDLPIREKPAESTPVTVTSTAAKQKPPEKTGQANLASEAAARAQQMKKNQAAARKASVEARQKATEKAGEEGVDKSGPPERLPVEEPLDAAPAATSGEEAVSKGAGETSDVAEDKSEEAPVGAAGAQIPDAETKQDDDEEESDDKANSSEHEGSEHEATPPTSSPPNRTTSKTPTEAETAAQSSGQHPRREAVDHTLDAAPATKSGLDAVTDSPMTQSEVDKPHTPSSTAAPTTHPAGSTEPHEQDKHSEDARDAGKAVESVED